MQAEPLGPPPWTILERRRISHEFRKFSSEALTSIAAQEHDLGRTRQSTRHHQTPGNDAWTNYDSSANARSSSDRLTCGQVLVSTSTTRRCMQSANPRLPAGLSTIEDTPSLQNNAGYRRPF